MPINSTNFQIPDCLAVQRDDKSHLPITKEFMTGQEELKTGQEELKTGQEELNNFKSSIKESDLGLTSLDKFIEGLSKITQNFKNNHSQVFNKIVRIGNKLSIWTNLTATVAEPSRVGNFKPLSRFATAANLFLTGAKGALVGFTETRDIIYAAGKASDVIATAFPQEWQFALRIGPSLSNFATAIRQEAGIDRYNKFSDAFKLAGNKITEYFNNIKDIGFINSIKPKNADKSLAFAVGAPLQAFSGSLISMISFIPFLPKHVKKLFRSIGYLNRFAGATSIDLYEGISKNAKSQFSGAAKLNFLAAAISDIVNKVSQVSKSLALDKLKLSEKSAIVKNLNTIKILTKNLTPTLESLGRVNNETAIREGINNPEYKVQGFKGIMSRYVSSLLESMLGIPAIKNSKEEILALQNSVANLAAH